MNKKLSSIRKQNKDNLPVRAEARQPGFLSSPGIRLYTKQPKEIVEQKTSISAQVEFFHAHLGAFNTIIMWATI